MAPLIPSLPERRTRIFVAATREDCEWQEARYYPIATADWFVRVGQEWSEQDGLVALTTIYERRPPVAQRSLQHPVRQLGGVFLLATLAIAAAAIAVFALFRSGPRPPADAVSPSPTAGAVIAPVPPQSITPAPSPATR